MWTYLAPGDRQHEGACATPRLAKLCCAFVMAAILPPRLDRLLMSSPRTRNNEGVLDEAALFSDVLRASPSQLQACIRVPHQFTYIHS